MSTMDGSTIPLVIGTVVFVAIVKSTILMWLLPKCQKRLQKGRRSVCPDSQFITLPMDKFLNDMEKEKPIRFTDQHLRIATDNYSYLLGSGDSGAVYKGSISKGTMIAVKVMHGGSNKRINQQFMAEVGTIGKIHHFNLVRLYGFCFERNLIALVYEYMENGSLDKHLFQGNKTLGYEKLHEIAVGTARGIAYLNEGCQQRIIHYDIKPGNILLDSNFNPKVADFGLAKLCNREKSHITLTGGRGTPGYAAPELWMPFPVNHKCDVFSFGMLLFEIIGRRRNHDTSLSDSQEWFPMWVWKRFDTEQVEELMVVCEIEEQNKDIAERMVKVALSCVQYRPESRPIMSVVVKMLEGSVEISKPLNPFQYVTDGTFPALPIPVSHTNTDTSIVSGSSVMVTKSSLEHVTRVTVNYHIELAST